MQASFPCCAQLDIKMRARKGICVQIMEKVNNALIWTELATKNFEKLLAGTPSASQHTQEVRRNCSTNMHAWNECAVLRTKSTRDHAHVYAIVLCFIHARQFGLTPKYWCYRFSLPVCYYHATHLILMVCRLTSWRGTMLSLRASGPNWMVTFHRLNLSQCIYSRLFTVINCVLILT